MKVGSGIITHGLSKFKIDQCGICSLRVKDNSVLCVHCVYSVIHGRLCEVKSVSASVSINFACWNIVEAVEQEERLCD